jgi:hypothetical protein
MHLQRETWATIGEKVGQRNLAVTANTYTHALIDGREIDRPNLLARVSRVRTVTPRVTPRHAENAVLAGAS